MNCREGPISILELPIRFRIFLHAPALVFVTLLALSGCGDDAGDEVKSLRIGVLPDESAEELSARYGLLLDYFGRATGIAFELVIPTTYGELLTLFNTEKVDLAYLGGFTFLKARTESGAVPLVMRDVDTRFTSLFLVKGNSPAKSIKDLKGKSFSFGSRLSTSGHLMPRHYLIRENIDPERFFAKVTYSGAHDKTVFLVRDGTVDAGVTNAVTLRRMIKEGKFETKDIRILWETPPYADYVWVAQRRLPEPIREKILEAFLEISLDQEGHETILRQIGANIFLPARSEDFNELQVIGDSLGMLN